MVHPNAVLTPRHRLQVACLVVDDYSRVAYAEMHDDERAVTASGVLRRAVAWFGARGITVDRFIVRQERKPAIPKLATSSTAARPKERK